MKLYTEEQVRKAALFSLAEDATMEKILESLTPIELPSNEEIEKAMIEQDIVRQQGYCHCFLEGAEWMRDKILNK